MNDNNKELEEVKEKVGKGLEVARWHLLDSYPFIGEMLLRFSIVPTYDSRIHTAATNGTKIFFDCEFYSKLTKGQREFTLAHEVWHNIYLHFLRIGTRNPELWNIATDMEINHMLQNEGMELIDGCCMPDPVVAGKSAEDIYNYLMKQMPSQSQSGKNGNDDGEGDSDCGNGGSGDDVSGNGSGGSNSSSKKNNGNGSGKKSTKKNKGSYGNQFDKHIYEGDSSDDGDGEANEGKWGPRELDADCNPTIEDPKEIEDNIKDMVCSVAQSIERKQGHLPAGIEGMVKEMLKPEIPWKEVLSQFYTKIFNGDHSWRRCSRHSLGRGMYLPGKSGEKIKTLVCVDTSGSCLSDIPKFFSELDSLARSFGNYEITILQCDAEIQKIDYFDETNPINIKDFKTKGFGGTSFVPPFNWLKEHGEDDYSCVIYLTDGYGDAPKYPPSIPTLWVLTSDGYKDFCDWGQKMKFKPQH